MTTIKELVDKHSKVPGDIRITPAKTTSNYWFRPFVFDISSGMWSGSSASAGFVLVWEGKDAWELYTEPQPKVVRWLWVDRHSAKLSVKMYGDNELPENWIKLEWSEQEFDE